jgi:hypothetical protein
MFTIRAGRRARSLRSAATRDWLQGPVSHVLREKTSSWLLLSCTNMNLLSLPRRFSVDLAPHGDQKYRAGWRFIDLSSHRPAMIETMA